MSMGRYLEIFRRTPTECEISEESEKSDQSTTYLREKVDLFRDRPQLGNQACEIRGTSFAANPLAEDLFRISRFLRSLQELERRCPAHVDPADWIQAVEDGRKFLALWAQQAEALGWTAHELFGLHAVPERPAATYRRLSRYDETGLIWLLHGRPVVALTESEAVIRGYSGGIVTYRKHNRPALGPLGDSLDDMWGPQL
jgi:hypothetical protein